MRLVPVGSLKKASVVAKAIYSDNGNTLLKEGVALSESLIEKLQSNGIISVYIMDNYSLGEIKDVISPEIRNKAVKEVKAVFDTVGRELKNQIKGMKNNHESLKKRLTMIVDQRYYDEISHVIDEMMSELSRNKDAMVGLVDIKSMNSFLYQHAVQVTVLSLIIGADMKLGNRELKDLAIGAMLHDIGLAMIDPKLWIYNDSFSEEETEIYKKHADLGYQFIKETSVLKASATIGILEHHENYDGSGYPLGLSGEKIHRNARIIAIADNYDMMTSGIDGRFIAQNEAIEYLMGSSGDEGHFDILMTTRFVRRIVPFPMGTYVKLSNGLLAVVVAYNMNHPMRPVIKIIEKGKTLEQLKKIDLMHHNHLNVTILGGVF